MLDHIVFSIAVSIQDNPGVKLHYNDAKRAGVIALGHLKLDRPSVEKEDETIRELAATGVKVAITELDIDVLPAANRSTSADVNRREEMKAALNPYADALPKDIEEKLARRYADLFAIFVKHKDVVNRVTFWGVSNGDSWLNNWPIRGRKSYPLLFDREHEPTPAFKAVIGEAKSVQR